MKINTIALLVLLLVPLGIHAKEESLASSAPTMKPRQILPAKFKSSEDIVHDMESFAPLGKDSVWRQEFRFGQTLHLLVIWFDAAPPQMSRDIPVEYTYYHDGKTWRFHSTSGSRMAAVSANPKLQIFVFLDSKGRQVKVISYKDVYKEQIKKLLEAEGNNSNN